MASQSILFMDTFYDTFSGPMALTMQKHAKDLSKATMCLVTCSWRSPTKLIVQFCFYFSKDIRFTKSIVYIKVYICMYVLLDTLKALKNVFKIQEL